MSKILILILSFSLYNCLCQAQNLSDQWVISEPNGCKLVDPYFQNGISITWDGPCIDNIAHGFGKLIKYNNGEYESTFEGYYNMGVREGMGTFSHKDGTSKSGKFINGQLMGDGTMKDLNGNSYVGNFINYRMHGNGIFRTSDLATYNGFFVSDRFYTGKISYANGNIVYVQQYNKVDTIIANKSNYSPEIGKEITEFFDSEWNRSSKDDASYFRIITYAKDNMPIGVIKDYYITGQLQSEYNCVYVDYNDEGKNFFEGKALWYYKNGNVEKSNFYFNNKINGTYTSYYENGKIKNEKHYDHDIQNGEYKQYYPNGKIELKGTISNDEKIGLWTFYDEDGNSIDKKDLSKSWDELNDSCISYFERNILDSARYYALISLEKVNGMDGNIEEYETSIYNVYTIDNKLENYSSSLNHLKKYIELQTEKDANYNFETIMLLKELGHLYWANKEIKTAEYYLKLHNENLEKLKGEYKEEYILSLFSLGIYYYENKDFMNAQPIFEKCKENHLLLAGKYNSNCKEINVKLASVYKYNQENEKCEKTLLELLDIEKVIGSINNEFYLSILTQLIDYYVNLDELNDLGQYEKAIPYCIEALDITVKNSGTSHIEYGKRLISLADLYLEIGHYENALTHYLQALENTEKNHGKSHSNYGNLLNSIGSLYLKMGQYHQVLPYYIEAMQITEKNLGKSHPEYGVRLNNLAGLYLETGQYEKGIPLAIEALENAEKNFGKSQPVYWRRLNSIGMIFQKLGIFNKALFFFEEALTNIKKYSGQVDPIYSVILNNIGTHYLDSGKYEKALNFFLEAIEIIEKKEGIFNPILGSIYNNCGRSYSELLNFEKAIIYYTASLNNMKKNIGEYHYKYAVTLTNLGAVYYYKKKYDDGISYTRQGCKLLLDIFSLNSKFLSEEDNENFYRLIQNELTNYKILLYLNKNTPEIENLYDLELQLKGIILRSSIDMRSILFNDFDSTMIKKYDEWMLFRNILAKQNSLPYEQRRADMNKIKDKCNQLETDLVRISAPFKEQLEPIKWRNIQHSLHANELAIEFIEIPIIEDGIFRNNLMLAALIVNNTEKYPQLVPLCHKKQIDSLFARTGTKESLFINGIYLDRRIYNLIWKPLEPFVKKGDNIYFAPSGILNQINLGSISTSDSTFLADEYIFNQVISTTVLTRSSKIQKADKNIAIFGGMDYEAEDREISKSIANINKDVEYVSRGLNIQDSTRSGKWSYLPGTKKEAENIYNISKDANLSTKLYMGAEAIEEQYKNLDGDKSPSILHIATHGFFFPDPKISKEKLDRLAFHTDNPFTIADNPMNRSGLLFSGSNKAWVGDSISVDREDGILTAYEASHTYLKNTELVVLSACETGLGDIKGSEGVYGLQRAFKMAGARYLMMSLWKVPDNATQDFMTTFYTELLTHKKSIREAYNMTQKQMRDKYRDEPYKWAGFVLME